MGGLIKVASFKACLFPCNSVDSCNIGSYNWLRHIAKGAGAVGQRMSFTTRTLCRSMGLSWSLRPSIARRTRLNPIQRSFISTLPSGPLGTNTVPVAESYTPEALPHRTYNVTRWEYAVEGSPLWPSNIMERAIEAIHYYSGFGWTSTIVIYTILMRGILLPALIKQTRSTVLAHNLKPTVQQMQSEAQLLRNQGRKEESYRKLREMSSFMSEKGINPASILGLSLLPLPFFMSTFFALRNMSKQPVASLLDGGMFWFENLTIPDPYYILPVISTAALMSTLEISRKFSPISNMSSGMVIGMRIFAAASLPVTCFMPSGLVLYFCVSNLISCIVQVVLAVPGVRRFFKIPAAKPTAGPAKTVGFLETFKESYRAHLNPVPQKSPHLQNRVIHSQKPKH